MLTIPDFAQPVLSSFAPVFYHPTYQRFLVLLLAAVLTTGRRTVSNLLRTAAGLGPGRRLQLSPRPLQTTLVHSRLGTHPDPLHPRPLGPRRARLAGRRRYRRRAPRRQGLRQGLSSRPGALDPFLHRLPLGAQMGRPGHPGPVPLRHSGLGAAGACRRCITARRRPPKRRPRPARRRRQKAKDKAKVQAKERARRKARPEPEPRTPKKKAEAAVRRRHKTPSELMRQLLAVLTHWFPERQFVFAGDGGYGTHALARFAARRRVAT